MTFPSELDLTLVRQGVDLDVHNPKVGSSILPSATNLDQTLSNHNVDSLKSGQPRGFLPALEIPIGRGLSALVDAEDFERFGRFRWHATFGNGGHIYAFRIEHGKRPLLHREILDAPVGMVVDHIDGNGLNCCRRNLRLATFTQNLWNGRKRRRLGSGLLGVLKAGYRWRGYVTANRRRYYTPSVPTPEQAAHARDILATALHGEFAVLNFPR